MIGWLQGELIEKKPPQLILNVQGVGYLINCSMTTFYHMPDIKQQTSLYIHFVVREDAQELYGFSSTSERDLFRYLIRVNGVGPKLALTILSSVSTSDFIHCVTQNDSASLVKIPGIGKKTAERLVIEMRDKLKDMLSDGSVDLENSTHIQLQREASPMQDALDALVSLGYKNHEAKRAVQNIENNQSLSSEQIIRGALKALTVQ